VSRVSSIVLDEPNLEDIGGVFRSNLEKNFKKVEVNVIDCPDLSLNPWDLTTKGFGGHRKIADVGGVDNLLYPENNWKTFQLEEVANAVGIPKGFVMGPGAGAPKNCGGVNAELIANTNIGTNENKSKLCKILDNGQYKQEDYKSNEIGLLANLLICEGNPCKVIHVRCSERSSEMNFVSCMRKAIEHHYKEKSVGIAGIFEIKNGKINAHVMPDFPKRDLLSDKEVNEWLRFYEMKAPLTCQTVFINSDHQKLGFRLEHTHFYSKHGDGGHYHFDTTPSEVEYEGYFVTCEEAYRVNPPLISEERKQFFHD